MDVIVNTDHNISVTETSTDVMESEVESTLEHFSSRLTRVEIHLSDASAGRSTGDDIRCESSFGKLDHHKGASSMGGESG